METTLQTPSNNGEMMVQRDEKGRVRPGSILNPGGKPKGTKHLSTLLDESLDSLSTKGGTDREVIVRKLIEMAKKGDMRAIALVWDRVEGKAIQSINQTSEFVISEENQTAANEALMRFLEKGRG